MDNHKRNIRESSLEDKKSVKKRCLSKTTLFPTQAFAGPRSPDPLDKPNINQDDLETEKDGSATDCEILPVIKTENNPECDGYLTDTDITENELEEKSIDDKHCSNQSFVTHTYLPELFANLKKEDKTFASEREKEDFSMESLKYFNVNGTLSLDDITSCLEYLQVTFGPTSHWNPSMAKPKATNVSNIDQNASCSSTVIPQNKLKSSSHAEQLNSKSIAGACTNVCKASPDNVIDSKVSKLEQKPSCSSTVIHQNKPKNSSHGELLNSKSIAGARTNVYKASADNVIDSRVSKLEQKPPCSSTVIHQNKLKSSSHSELLNSKSIAGACANVYKASPDNVIDSKISKLEQNASCSSTVIPQNKLNISSHAVQLNRKSNVGAFTNVYKASSDSVIASKVPTFEKVPSNICVSEGSSITEPATKKIDKRILKAVPPVTPLSKVPKPAAFSNSPSTFKADSKTFKQNAAVMVENAKAVASMNKRKNEETCKKSLSTSKKVKEQHSRPEMSNRSFTDSIPTSVENMDIQTTNPRSSRLYMNQLPKEHSNLDMANRSFTDSISSRIQNTRIPTMNLDPRSSQLYTNQLPDVRDPRLRRNSASRTNGYQLDSQSVATNVGTNQLHEDFVPTHQEMPFCILDWDPKWLMIKKDDYPPVLGGFKPPHVKDIYTSKDEYSKTYCSIHLLSIWQAIHFSYKCQTQTQTEAKTYKCNVQNVEEVRSYFKNECIALMPFNDMPKYSSIILIAWHFNGMTKNCFAYVYEVKPTAAHRASQDSNSSCEDREICKIKFYCYTTQKIENYKKIHIVIQKLCRIRVHLKQYEALCLPENSDLTESIINPFRNAHKIKAVFLPSNDWMDHIKNFVIKWQSKIAMSLIFNLNNNETLIILTLVRYLMTRSTILICMRDMGKFLKIAKQLENRCILAVKESEVSVPKDIQQHTIRSKAKELCKARSMPHEKAELQVLKQSKIILTLISSMYFSDTTTPILGSNLICIIDDAHKCTEADTSLPLSFNPANVFLLGDSTQYPNLDHRQQRLKYTTTLFHRLSKYAK